MSASKHFDKIAWGVTALVLIIAVLLMNGGALGLESAAITMGYEKRLFDNTRVHTIDIVMNNWDEFISNATSEEYYTASVVIDGEAYKNIAIRGKGNTSLSNVASMNSDRYSFKIEFDHYDSAVTYHGLDKLSLNNLIQDTTMMKDYLTYTMMNEFGAAAPLCSFVYITVNGDDWGLYLAVEGVEDAFLKRNYGSDYGELYKPDSMSFGGGRGNGKDFNMNDFMNRGGSSDNEDQGMTMPQMPDMGNFDFSKMPQGFEGGMPDMGNFEIPGMSGTKEGNSENGEKSSSGGRGDFSFGGMGGFGMGSSDVKLQYIDDSIESYSNIWNNAKTDITEADQKCLIDSLEALSKLEDVESVVDIEQVIRYFVVHNYVCNGDSYTGQMIHNYYLYEEKGQMSMIPWDYNLAYGTFQGGNGASTVNTPIDAPVSGGAGEDRPMWSWILSDNSYTELYHQYFSEFLDTVDVQGIIDDAYNLIRSYVEKDPTAFYTYEEFEKGVETIKQFCRLRSESISMQLQNGETKTNMGYADASGITLSDMGSMGGGKGGFGGGMPNAGGNIDRGFGGRTPSGSTGSSTENSDEISGAGVDAAAGATFDVPTQAGDMPGGVGGFDMSQIQGDFGGQMPNMGESPEGAGSSQMPGGFGGSVPGGRSEKTENVPSDNGENAGTSQNSSRPSRDNMQMPGGNFGGIGNMGSTAKNDSSLVWLVASVLILGAGLIVAKVYK